MEKSNFEAIRAEHVGCILNVGADHFQAICTCGWSSTINFLEHVDLLRAMHAHAVVTFGVYA